MTITSLPGLEVANANFVTPQLLVGGDLDVNDTTLAVRQLFDLVRAGVTHIVDVREECDDTEFVTGLDASINYLWHGVDDAGQRIPVSWFDATVGFVLTALEDPEAVVLTHCHMGINRGPSLGYAVLLAQGWDPVEAIGAIRSARPVAHVAYAEDALRWHHERTGVEMGEQRRDRDRLAQWRRDNPLDVIRIIARARQEGQ